MNKDLIMFMDIRSLNSIRTKLQILIESLEVKPFFIVCSETRIFEYYKYYTFSEYNIYNIQVFQYHNKLFYLYKIFYNSKINICDVVVVYIKDKLTESTETIKIWTLSVPNSSISIENNNRLEISALNRSHYLPNSEFIFELAKFLDTKKK